MEELLANARRAYFFGQVGRILARQQNSRVSVIRYTVQATASTINRFRSCFLYVILRSGRPLSPY